MMTPFQLKSKKYRRPLGVVGLIIPIVIILIVIGVYMILPRLVGNVSKQVLVAGGQAGETIASATDHLRSKQSIIDENYHLRDELSRLQGAIADRAVLQKENEELKTLLGRSAVHNTLILSRVLAKPPVSPYDSLVLDIGKSEGVTVGDRVVAGNAAIGEIVEVGDGQSKVRLFSSPGSEFQVEIGSNHVSAKAVGIGGGNFKVELPKGTIVATGDEALLPGLDSKVYGTVVRIDGKESDPFVEALFTLPVNIYELKWVQVETR